MEKITRRAALASIPAMGTAAIVPAMSEPLDAALIRLGAEFDAAWARERELLAISNVLDTEEADDEWVAAMDVTREFVHKIERLPAQTIDGLKVQARALSWCYCGEEIDFRDGQDTTDARLANQIIATLLAI